MNKHDQYEAWKAELYEALRDNMPDLAGKALGENGEFENVGFQVASAHGDDGKHGGAVVAVTLVDRDSAAEGKHVQVEGNWHWDDAVEVARNAITAYVKLRGQYEATTLSG